MDKIRVYEAARKLNIETRQLIIMLSKKGIVAQSPISFISNDDFNELLNSMTAKPDDPQEGPEKKTEQTGAVVDNLATLKERPKLSLAPTISTEATEKSAPPKIQPAPVKSERQAGSAPKKADRPNVKKTSAPAPVPGKQMERGAGGSSILSYLALGFSAVALLAIFVINSDVTRNGADLSKTAQTLKSIQADVASTSDGVSVNQDMIFQNRDAIGSATGKINTLKKDSVKMNLSQRSATLEELSSNLPGQSAKDVMSISKQLGALAGSL